MTTLSSRKILHVAAIVAIMVLLTDVAFALPVKINKPPFVKVTVVPTVGFVNETFSIYLTAGDTDGHLTAGEITLNGEDIATLFSKMNSTTWLYDYVPSTAGDCKVSCTVTDNVGAASTSSATFKVTEPVYSIRPIELHDDLPKLTEWEDFDFWANMRGSDGKNYYIDILMILKSTGSDQSNIKLDNQPASVYFNGTQDIIEENPLVRTIVEAPVTIQKFEDTVVYSLTQRFPQRLTVKFTLQPPNLHTMRISSGNSYIELRFHTRGLPFWYNEGAPFHQAATGQAMGYEIFSDVEGVLVNGGKSILLNGTGVMEHWWSSRWNWKDFTRLDWAFFNFKELYGLVTDLVSNNDTYLDGGIYLMKEKQYLVVDIFSIEYPEWAYFPTGQYYVPTKISISASTSSGILKVTGQIQGFQQVVADAPYYNIPGINMSGTFTYSNGTIMTLTGGSGWGQDISIHP